MNFTGDQVLRVVAKNEEQLSLLRGLEGLKRQKDFHFGSVAFKPRGLLAWPSQAQPPCGYESAFSELKDVKAYLESHGLLYSIMIKDIQVLLDKEREAMGQSRRLQRSTTGFSYYSYHALEEVYSWMDSFVTEHSDVVSKIQIGHSFENRTILVLKNVPDGLMPPLLAATGCAKVLLCSTSEESPAGPPSFTLNPRCPLLRIVSENGKDPILTNILNAMDIFVEVVTNPDGFAFTHSMNRLWRKNKSTRPGIFCMRVDLNRNWKSGFGGNGSNSNPCSETYHGPSPQLEPEVAAIVDFITSRGNIQALTAIRSCSQMLMYLMAIRWHLFQTRRSWAESELDVASGIMVDWAYESGIKYAFTFELWDTGRYGFLLLASQIIATAQETWLALRTIMEYTVTHPC
ncbi:Carboxypeptidase A5 [Manis pentadactyla]|nr:Carboxypeptidase A5 [Manis pentadactyla]